MSSWIDKVDTQNFQECCCLFSVCVTRLQNSNPIIYMYVCIDFYIKISKESITSPSRLKFNSGDSKFYFEASKWRIPPNCANAGEVGQVFSSLTHSLNGGNYLVKDSGDHPLHT